MAVVYSILPEGSDDTLFDIFVNENATEHQTEIEFIFNRLYAIGYDTGGRHGFFKHNEGEPGDGVCALYDEPEYALRLYCIRYGSVAIILGGGGPKPKGIKAWQDDDKLKQEAEMMIQVSKDIEDRRKNGDIWWSDDRTELLGDFKFEDNEE